MTSLILALVLTSGCEQVSDVEVVCDTQSFRDLTTIALEASATAAKLQLELTSKEVQLAAAQAALKALPAPTAPRRITPVVAVAMALIGGLAFTTSFTTDFSPELRLGLGITGVAAVAGGFVLAFF